MGYLKVYTKTIEEKIYDAGLAHSVHMSAGISKATAVELYQGYGILFPKAVVRENDTIDPRGALNPKVLNNGDEYVIVCDYVNEAGENCAPSEYFAWSTKDFVSFKELGLVASAEYDTATDEIEIPDELLKNISDRWIPLKAVSVKAVDGRAEVTYSDSSKHMKNIKDGLVQSTKFKYPLLVGFADPVFFKWQNKWYYLATNDLNGNIGIFLREADTIEGLFEEGHKESILLDYDEEKEYIQTFWAPEWHIIGGVPYILFAVGGKQWAPHSHMMKYKGSGSIMEPANWETPVRVCKKDGSFLCTEGITLDMTYVKSGERSYVLWSERYHTMEPLDTGSMIFIAEIDEKNPTRLISDKTLLTRPLYGWENVAGTINNEGPYSLKHDGKIYVAYSGGAACGHTYAVGYLIAEDGADLLKKENWNKQIWPSLHAYSVEGVDGPGHNSFFVDDNGDTFVAYHGQPCGRASAAHRVHFDKNGYPVLNMSPERDLPANLTHIEP